MSAAQPYLELRQTSFATADGKMLVQPMSLAVYPGEIAVLVGPNGAGKTSLIRMVAGLAMPTGGHIYIGGKPLSGLSYVERARAIAYVGQSENPDGRLTVAQYVALGGLQFEAGGAVDRQAKAAIDAVGLSGFAHVSMDRLSGGEQQKAKIARAICQKPRLLVLDEPTNHLDPQARGDLLTIVARLGITLVVVLHDLTLIEAFADKVAIIENGRLLAFGAPRDTLSPQRVQDVFGVAIHRFDHPSEARHVPALDIAIARQPHVSLQFKETS